MREILLVEDNPDDFAATERAFLKAGFADKLVHAPSGEKAFEYLQTATRPSLIVLDLNMPGMGGRSFLEKVKQDATLREIPVVVLSGSNDEADIKACYALGANAYILKSADFKVLATAIKRLKEHWFETVALPSVFDETDEGTGAPAFSVSGDSSPGASSAVRLSPQDVKEKILGPDSYKPLGEKDKLTPPEVETLTWIARGKSRWETGVILGVSEDTVKARLEKCRQKLGASNTTHAIAIALLHDLFQ